MIPVMMAGSASGHGTHRAWLWATASVRGHEKVPTGGQVPVPVVGQLKVPVFACRVQGEWPCAVTVAGANPCQRTTRGASIEEREGTDGCVGCLSGGGHLPRCRGDLRDDAQDGEADR